MPYKIRSTITGANYISVPLAVKEYYVLKLSLSRKYGVT